MFEVPDAKRVRREELYDSTSDRHSSPERDDAEDAELRAKLNARLSNLLSLDLPTAPAPPAPSKPLPDATDGPHTEGGESQAEADPEEAEFSFRLFSTSDAAQKVVLAEEEDAKYDGPAISQRPLSHYIRGELSLREREQFCYAAVTGDDVFDRARQRAWGLEVPWRVTKLTVTVRGGGKGITVVTDGLQRQAGQGSGESETAATKRKKTRPGKKSRIVQRKREKAKKVATAVLEKQKTSKEEHLREKKKRLNREKKLKRRQKEKEKKLAAKGAAGDGEGVELSESEGDSDGEE